MLVSVTCRVPWLASGHETAIVTVATWLGAPVTVTVQDRL